jgi:hypothetical protein
MPPGHILSELARETFSDVRTLGVGENSFTHALLEGAKGELQKPTRAIWVLHVSDRYPPINVPSVKYTARCAAFGTELQ